MNHPNNCPISERTADGAKVGRCWMSLKYGVCERHGDVSEYVKRLPQLTDENELRRDRGLPEFPIRR